MQRKLIARAAWRYGQKFYKPCGAEELVHFLTARKNVLARPLRNAA